MVLLAADGLPNGEIALKLGYSQQSVCLWRKRYLDHGIQGLHDELKPGRPRTISDERVATLIRRTLKTKPVHGTHWTIRSIAQGTRISNTTKFGTQNLLDGTVGVAGTATFQIGAFSGETETLTISDQDATALGVNALDVTSSANATLALASIDNAISVVTAVRGDLGAFASGTPESTKNNNMSQLVNLQHAESILRDTDFQKEIATFTSEQIRQQAASTVLGMANQSSQSILQLLRG